MQTSPFLNHEKNYLDMIAFFCPPPMRQKRTVQKVWRSIPLSDDHASRLAFVFQELCVSFLFCLWHFDDGVFADTLESFLADGGHVGADHYFGQFFLRLFEDVFADGGDLRLYTVYGDVSRDFHSLLIGDRLYGDGVGGSCPVCVAACGIGTARLQSSFRCRLRSVRRGGWRLRVSWNNRLRLFRGRSECLAVEVCLIGNSVRDIMVSVVKRRTWDGCCRVRVRTRLNFNGLTFHRGDRDGAVGEAGVVKRKNCGTDAETACWEQFCCTSCVGAIFLRCCNLSTDGSYFAAGNPDSAADSLSIVSVAHAEKTGAVSGR